MQRFLRAAIAVVYALRNILEAVIAATSRPTEQTRPAMPASAAVPLTLQEAVRMEAATDGPRMPDPNRDLLLVVYGSTLPTIPYGVRHHVRGRERPFAGLRPVPTPGTTRDRHGAVSFEFLAQNGESLGGPFQCRPDLVIGTIDDIVADFRAMLTAAATTLVFGNPAGTPGSGLAPAWQGLEHYDAVQARLREIYTTQHRRDSPLIGRTRAIHLPTAYNVPAVARAGDRPVFPQVTVHGNEPDSPAAISIPYDRLPTNADLERLRQQRETPAAPSPPVEHHRNIEL